MTMETPIADMISSMSAGLSLRSNQLDGVFFLYDLLTDVADIVLRTVYIYKYVSITIIITTIYIYC